MRLRAYTFIRTVCRKQSNGPLDWVFWVVGDLTVMVLTLVHCQGGSSLKRAQAIQQTYGWPTRE